MWRVIGSSTQESSPTDDTFVRMPEPRAVPSLQSVKCLSNMNHISPNSITELCHNNTGLPTVSEIEVQKLIAILVRTVATYLFAAIHALGAFRL